MGGNKGEEGKEERRRGRRGQVSACKRGVKGGFNRMATHRLVVKCTKQSVTEYTVYNQRLDGKECSHVSEWIYEEGESHERRARTGSGLALAMGWGRLALGSRACRNVPWVVATESASCVSRFGDDCIRGMRGVVFHEQCRSREVTVQCDTVHSLVAARKWPPNTTRHRRSILLVAFSPLLSSPPGISFAQGVPSLRSASPVACTCV